MATEKEVAEKYQISRCAAADLINILKVCEKVFTENVEVVKQMVTKIIVDGDHKTQSY